VDYHAYLLTRLKNAEETVAYLQAALEESVRDQNYSTFYTALNDVFEAHNLLRTDSSKG